MEITKQFVEENFKIFPVNYGIQFLPSSSYEKKIKAMAWKLHYVDANGLEQLCSLHYFYGVGNMKDITKQTDSRKCKTGKSKNRSHYVRFYITIFKRKYR